MAVKPFENNPKMSRGGLSALFFASAADVAAVETNAAQDAVVKLVLKSGCRLVRYTFAEDSASFAESLACKEGIRHVKHRIAFELNAVTPGNSTCILGLLENNCHGFVAVAVTPDGHAFLAGYSCVYGLERPLRVESIETATKEGIAERGYERIVLASDDGDLSLPLSGGILSHLTE